MWEMVQHLLKGVDSRISFLKQLYCSGIKDVWSQKNKNGAAVLFLVPCSFWPSSGRN